MSFRFEFDTTNRILRASIDGVIGDKEIAEFRVETARLVLDAQPSACLIDLSNVTKYDISNASILMMAQSSPALPGAPIPVVVVAAAPHMFGATRVFQITSEDRRPWLHVVKSSGEAYELLNVKSPSFEPVPSDPDDRKKMWSQSSTDS